MVKMRKIFHTKREGLHYSPAFDRQGSSFGDVPGTGIVKMSSGPRLMVVSKTFPPLVSGTPILLSNLLRSFQGDLVAVAGYSHYAREDPTFQAPCQTVYFRPPRIHLLERVYDRAIPHLRGVLRAFIRCYVRRWLPDVMMCPFPAAEFFIPAFQVARKLGIPFYAHMHDLWQENYSSGQYRRKLADHWEEKILKQSQRVLCMTELQQEHYMRKYRIQSDILPHTITSENLADAPDGLLPPSLSKRTVLFVGNYSAHMNADALRVLAEASELLPPDIELLFCTGISSSDFTRIGIKSSRLRVIWVSRTEVLRIQSSAHVLVAPLSHKNCSSDEVHTVFSTKLLEYLVAGRPIVVFAPPNSFHAQSARQGNWGYVIDRDDPVTLAEGIIKVMEDEELASKLVKGALQEARRRDARIHAQRLYEWIVEDSIQFRNNL